MDDEYYCYECGAKMKLLGDVLVCPKCKHSVDLEDYYCEEETYEEIYGRLDPDLIPDEIDLYSDIYDD